MKRKSSIYVAFSGTKESDVVVSCVNEANIGELNDRSLLCSLCRDNFVTKAHDLVPTKKPERLVRKLRKS